MNADFAYALAGASLLLAVILPVALMRVAITAPMVLLTVGALIGLLPMFDGEFISPVKYRGFTEHLTEFTVIVALMGVGLALDRPLDIRSRLTWKSWGATWRLLGIAMPLCIGAVAFLGWWAMGLAPAAAVLLGAALAPTDPVLASDVQVDGPTHTEEREDEIDEQDEVRFALTSEAGLNDGLAFPFLYLAIFLASMGPITDWALRWLAWELVGKVVVGAVAGWAVGWVLAKSAFRSRRPSLRLAETGEPLLALAAVLLAYGVAELAQGYGFLAVFACAMTLRSAERGSQYHAYMHETVQRLERLLTLVVLLLLGIALTNGMLRNLTWEAMAVGIALVFLIRPLSGVVSCVIARTPLMGDRTLTSRERSVASFFGVRGVGSLFYLAYATGQAGFGNVELLWATVGFTIALSVIVHGVTVKPALRWLDRERVEPPPAGRAAAEPPAR